MPDHVTRVLLADDDTLLAGMLVEYLESEHYEVVAVADGQQALDQISAQHFDIVVLDIMMPVLGGIDTLRQIRLLGSLPVIMLTARGDDLDRILGLELGADDYIAKPCNPRELLARIRAVLRRSESSAADTSQDVDLGDLQLFPGSRRLVVSGAEPALTQTEFDLLYLLATNAGQLVTKAEMSSAVLGKPLSQWDRSIDVHISNLRKKLGAHADQTERIRTLRGSGYLYQLPPDSETT